MNILGRRGGTRDCAVKGHPRMASHGRYGSGGFETTKQSVRTAPKSDSFPRRTDASLNAEIAGEFSQSVRIRPPEPFKVIAI